MVLRKKSQAVFAGIMVAVMVFIVLVQFIEPIKDQVIVSRNATNLDCTNSSISTGQRMTCIVADLFLFYFFGAGIAAGIGYLVGRRIRTS